MAKCREMVRKYCINLLLLFYSYYYHYYYYLLFITCSCSYYCSPMPSKFPYTVCKFNVHNNHRAIFCDSCHNWTHLKCTPFTSLEYIATSKSNDDWYYSTCLASILSFNHFDSDIDFFSALYDFSL